MWMFDTKENGSGFTTVPTSKRAALRGMGATMCYLPDKKQSIWYVAAQNVSPAAYEMWLFDAVNDRWTELKPNGGKSIGELAGQEKNSTHVRSTDGLQPQAPEACRRP